MKRLANNLIRISDKEHFNPTEMKFLHEMYDSQLLTDDMMKYISRVMNEKVIKGVRALMNEGYNFLSKDLYNTVIYIAKENLLSDEKFDRFLYYITHRKTGVDGDQAFDWYNVYKDSKFDKLSINNFRAFFNGGLLIKIYNSSKVPIGYKQVDQIIDLCDEYIGEINDTNEWTLVDLAYVLLKGGDEEHVDLMHEYDSRTSKPDKELFKYIRDLITNNEDVDLLRFIFDYSQLTQDDIEDLMEYYKHNKNLDSIGDLLDSGLTMEEALNYHYDDEDADNYINNYDDYVNEQDSIDEDENANQYLRVSKRIKKRLRK